MPLSAGFADYVVDLLADFGAVEVKRMFGGAGVYRDGVMFAILDDDALYFRTDAALAADLRAQGSIPWVYSMKKDGAVREMGYWRMPETAVDDPDEVAAIARRAYAAALIRKARRAAKPAKKAGATRKSPPAPNAKASQ